MSLAPIALFAYKRPEHVRRTLESLSRCTQASQSRLTIFCDGPKSPSEARLVEQVHQVVEDEAWCGNVTVEKHDHNRGLARSVIDGVTRLCQEHGRVIVLEDDMLLSRGFLVYHNEALRRYEHTERVLQISAHVFPFPRRSRADDAYFMPLSTSQGWSTWERAWNRFDADATGWERLMDDGPTRERFDLDDTFPYTQMLIAQMQGRIDSWAIRWWWSFFVNDGLCLFPRKSLVVNIGFDDQATHTKSADMYYNDPDWTRERAVGRYPDRVAVDEPSFEGLKAYLFRSTDPSIFATLLYHVKGVIRRWNKAIGPGRR